jgi:HAMP domain-containing protein
MALEETMLDLFQTFAVPLATIFVSVAALVVTVAQWRIARAQKEIAYDKLKHDTFDRRYEIYQAAKALIEIICKSPVSVANPEVKKLRLKLTCNAYEIAKL